MNTSAASSKKRTAPIFLIALGLMAATLLCMFVLCLVPGAGENSKSPKLVIIAEDKNLPVKSLTNTLHATGFEYEVITLGEELPSGKNLVVMSFEDECLTSIDMYSSDENVKGFILMCPEITEILSEGFSSSYPDADVAIFAGKDNSDSTEDIGDAKVIYEYLTGDDTVYGTSAKRGGLFASKLYFSNDQRRVLSLSAFNVRDPYKLLFSPLFQNELAGYLSVTYFDESTRETSFGRINAWFIMSYIAFAASVISVLLFISNLRLSPTGSDTKKAPVSMWVYGLIGGISIACTIGIIASTSLGQLFGALPFILTLMPCVFMLCLFIINFKWIYNTEVKFEPSKKDYPVCALLAAVIGLYVLMILISHSDLELHRFSGTGSGVAFVMTMFVVDLAETAGLIFASRKSSFAGQGAKNCFGNTKIFLLMLLPSAAALLYGLVPGQTAVFYSGLAGLMCTAVPYACARPLIKHTERTLLPAALHALVYALLLASSL